MHALARSLIAALAVSLAFVAGTASAEVQVAETRITATATALTFTGTEVSVVCEVTLTATLGSTRIEPGEAVIGNVTEARANEASCAGGRLRLQSETLPWPVRLTELEHGILQLQVGGFTALVDAAGGLARCSYQGNLEATNDADPIGRLSVDETLPVLLSRRLGGIFCPSEVSIRGSFVLALELHYTLTEAAGRPLRPFPRLLSFMRRRVTQSVLFTNEWFIPIVVTGRAIEAATRFALVAERRECVEEVTIFSGETCTDSIALVRERRPGEPEGAYLVEAASLTMGRVELTE